MKRFCEASMAFEAVRCRHLQPSGERFYGNIAAFSSIVVVALRKLGIF